MASFSSSLVTFSLLLAAVTAFVDYGTVYPVKYALGSESTIEANTAYHNQPITLSSQNPILTIDYGTETAGFQFFEVATLSGLSQIEVKYAEEYPALSEPQSDGPWTFTIALANTFRVETFNLTSTGRTESFFVQRGQRWETVRLLTNTTVTFGAIGLRASSAHVAASDVPRQLTTSNSLYNYIWDLGARVVQAACVDVGNAPSTWQISSTDGAFIRDQQTAQFVKGTGFANYTLSFTTKIVRGGTGWRVPSTVFPIGAYFVLTSDYPFESTFVNTNRKMVPPNTLVFGEGYSILNQSTLQTGWDQYFTINENIYENEWYNISTSITEAGYRVSLNDHQIAFVPIFEAQYLGQTGDIPTSTVYSRTWGFGPWQDQEAYVKEVTVTAANGTLLYENDMKSEATLAEYNVAPLDTPVCLDGAKRDREVWIGDFCHTDRVIAASTARFDYVLGSIEYAFSYQDETGPYAGFVPSSPLMGTRPEYKDAFYSGLYGVLIDY